jgi:release factor glutamine methyltransferase
MAARLGETWRAASQRIDRLDARLLLEHVSGCTHADLIAHSERELTPAQAAQFAALLARRADGEPLAYLVGSAGFYGREFLVSPAVLIPRPDTELLVELAAQRARGLAAPRLVDLGTGSGIVAVTLARLCPAAAVSAVELSAAALVVARTNAARHGVSVNFLAGSWYAPLGDACFDLIVANPPYVLAGDPHLRQNGLDFEPPGALTDGVADGDGLSCLRAIIAGASAHLVPGGWLLVEHGYDQAASVRALLAAAGFLEVASWRDLAGIERVSGGRLR